MSDVRTLKVEITGVLSSILMLFFNFLIGISIDF